MHGERGPRSRPSSTIDPTTLSTALCRPTSSRSREHPTAAVEHGRGVAANRSTRTAAARRRRASGIACQQRRGRTVPSGGNGSSRLGQLVELIGAAPAAARRHVAEPRRRRRALAVGLDGDDVELGSPSRCRRRSNGRRVTDRPVEHPFGETEPRRQLVVVPGRPHRGGHERVVELDRHRLLDDQVVGSPLDDGRPLAADGDPIDDQPLRAGACHPSNATPTPETR